MNRKIKKLFKDLEWHIKYGSSLGFYLDKDVSFRFKLMNLISGDDLRMFFVFMKLDLEDFEKYLNWELPDGAIFYAKRAKRHLDKEWNYYVRNRLEES